MSAHFTSFSVNKKGFTLIELLVVISIIAILSSVGMVVFSGVQKQARITKRVQDLKAIQTALEIYFQTNKIYPSTGGSWRSECPSWVGASSDQVVPGLVPGFMLTFPSDPYMNKTASTACYKYRSNGTDYKLQDFSVSEMTSADFQTQPSLIDTATDGGDCSKVDGTAAGWAVYSSNIGGNLNNPACWN